MKLTRSEQIAFYDYDLTEHVKGKHELSKYEIQEQRLGQVAVQNEIPIRMPLL